VLVLFSGRPLTLERAAEHSGAVLEAWFPGVEAGPALAATLYGDSNPSGRLTASFPRSVGQLPLYYNHLNTGRPQQPGRHQKYRSQYIDEENTPLYPFGFGLSYTTFDYGPVEIEAPVHDIREIETGKAVVKVATDVTNSGERAGETVAQLYISQRGTSVARPVRELKGFQKVALHPGETRRLSFTLGRDELAFWNIDMKQVVERGMLSIWISSDSGSGMPAELDLR
jgi:beta-glucosidase